MPQLWRQHGLFLSQNHINKKVPVRAFFLPSMQNRTNLSIAIYLPLAGAECYVYQKWEIGGGVGEMDKDV